jgi:UDPglucose 6-dehydrogenase
MQRNERTGNMMNVTVIGTGYVGLVAGACFAARGRHVTCVDIDKRKVAALVAGQIPIYEPGLNKIVQDSVASAHLAFTTETGPAVQSADVVFIAVGTPPSEDGSADLRHVANVARAIAPHLRGYTAVVCKSTVPIGTCEKVDALLRKGVTQGEWDVVSNPEFLKEGAAVEDFLKPERVVIGTASARAREVMTHLYAPYVRRPVSDDDVGGGEIIYMAVRAAEMTKYAANCMLATRISFMNEIAQLCDNAEIDVDDVKRGIGTDSRIGPKFLNSGIGYGGSCFPKDVQALLRTGLDHGVPMRLLHAVEDVNRDQKRLLANRVAQRLGSDLSGRRVGLLGLAFKPETDDMREAPSQIVVRVLRARGATVVGYDPVARETATEMFGEELDFVGTWQEAVTGVDAVLVLTEWQEFRAITPEQLAAATDCRLVLDGRNVWQPDAMAAAGFDYEGIGRGPGR